MRITTVSAAAIGLVAVLILAPHARRAAEATPTAATQAVDSGMIMPAASRDSENARLRAFGVKLPEGGVLLERPWSPPFTRRSFVVPQSWLTHRPADSVSADALALDIPVLAQVMERAYGGWNVAKQRGWNWDKWFADWMTMLHARAGRSLSLADAFAPMKQFMAFQLDNHTTIPLRGPHFGSSSQSFAIQGSPTAPCTEIKTSEGGTVALDTKDPAQRPRRANRWNATARALEPISYMSLPANRGTPTSIHCGSDWLATSAAWPVGDMVDRFAQDSAARARVIRSLSGAATDGPNFKILETGIAYVRMPTFDERNAQLIEQRAASWPKPVGGERVLIVDLRDNGGGNITFRPLVGWLDQRRTQPAEAVHRTQGASCLYHALRWGYVTISTSSIKPPVNNQMTRRLQGSVDDLFQASPTGCSSQFEDSNSNWDYRRHAMRPSGMVDGHLRLLVLVNNGCGSDCEFMTQLLAYLPETVIVGTNTFGVAQYIQPGYSVLPHTRLPFRIALGTADAYGDNRSFDGYGFDVDILLATEQDQSPQNILALARYLGVQ